MVYHADNFIPSAANFVGQKLCHDPCGKAFAIGLVSFAQFNVSRRHAKNLSVTSRDGVSTSPTISICLLFKREVLKTVQARCQNRFLDSFSRVAAANLRRHI